MNQGLKQRLVGAVVLVILGIIVLPMILDKPVSEISDQETVNDVIENEITPIERPLFKKQPNHSIPPEVSARYEEKEAELKAVSVPKDEIKIDPKLSLDKSVVAKKVPTKIPKESKKKVENKATKKIEGKPYWAVQIGSFSSKENASRLVKRLKADKLPAYFEDLSANGKTIYRVRVGPIDSKSAVEKLKQKLDQKEKTKTLIVVLQ